MPPRHIVDARDFDRPALEALFALTDRILAESPGQLAQRLAGRVVATLFFEPSTRTRLSFESATLRLGGGVISVESAKESSSASKGESIEDTARIVSGYADAIVMRHFEAGMAKRAASVSPVPIINAGDGADQHPTQALLDLYTIQKELGRIDELSLALVGDLAHGRTVRSLIYLLKQVKNARLVLVAPEVVQLKADMRAFLDAEKIAYRFADDLAEVAPEVDVIYQTRIQKERFADASLYARAVGHFIVDAAVLDRMKTRSILMHPFPRNDEIHPEVDHDPRAAYFRQSKNGVAVRMALLAQCLG